MANAIDKFPSSRVVLDTNVRISAILSNGIPHEVLDLLRSSGFVQVISSSMMIELTRILQRKLRKSPNFVAAELNRIAGKSLLVAPTLSVATCRDPDVNHILECALAGRADYIVSGDKDLLTLNPFQQIPILTPRQFLDLHTPPSHLE